MTRRYSYENENFSDAINVIDSRYITEAVSYRGETKVVPWGKISVAAACILLTVSFTAAIFIRQNRQKIAEIESKVGLTEGGMRKEYISGTLSSFESGDYILWNNVTDSSELRLAGDFREVSKSRWQEDFNISCRKPKSSLSISYIKSKRARTARCIQTIFSAVMSVNRTKINLFGICLLTNRV